MRTILVVYTKERITSQKVLRTTKQYSFNTSDEVSVGDMLKSESYNTNMQVVRVLDKSFTYYNAVTGELSDDFKSSAQREIVTLKIRNDEQDVVYASKIIQDA